MLSSYVYTLQSVGRAVTTEPDCRQSAHGAGCHEGKREAGGTALQ